MSQQASRHNNFKQQVIPQPGLLQSLKDLLDKQFPVEEILTVR
jgi:hypothetical protein